MEVVVFGNHGNSVVVTRVEGQSALVTDVHLRRLPPPPPFCFLMLQTLHTVALLFSVMLPATAALGVSV